MDISAPECAADEGSLCQWIWDTTGIDVVAANSDAALSAVLHIVLIVIIALVVRFIVYRSINRLTRLTIDGNTPSVLRPLRAQAGRSPAASPRSAGPSAPGRSAPCSSRSARS